MSTITERDPDASVVTWRPVPGYEVQAASAQSEGSRMTSIAERVAKGAQFLDEWDPEWWREDVERAIDLDKLRLESLDSCVLGQRCPLSVLADYLGMPERDLESYDRLDAYRAYGGFLSGIDNYLEVGDWARGLGFNAHHGFAEWDSLTAEWKRVITERRSA